MCNASVVSCRGHHYICDTVGYQHIYRYLLKSGKFYSTDSVCGRNAAITSASIASEYSSEGRSDVKRLVAGPVVG